ncbi:antirestriction protein ArdA [Candidatus Corynebacterium faecigallinarum]|uniref:antirestriction protein ArdA n=1 Tax=Candidatus Corynebacterium faecigallinarum TaxID=2838528 RepID=UPI003FCF1B5E
MSTPTTSFIHTVPRVWAGCCACRAAGDLVGAWFDATEANGVTPDDVHGDRAPEDHEEYWCYDTEGFPSDLGEMSLQEAQAWADALTAVEERLRPALLAWVETGCYVTEGNSCLPSAREFHDRYCGHWAEFSDYAGRLALDTAVFEDVPDHLAAYIDMERWTRDLSYDYVTEPAGDGVYVFRCI